MHQPHASDVDSIGVEDADGTRVVIHARGEAGGFYKIAAPLLNRMVRKNIQKDLDTLKAHLEAHR